MSQPATSTPAEKVTIRVIVADPAVRVAFLIIFVIMLGFGIVAPILPLYARSFGVSYETASLMIASFAFARLLTDPVAGPLVERFGERRVSMAGVVTVGVSAFLTALAPTFLIAVLLRGAGGVGSSLLFTAIYSYLLKVVPSDRMGRTFSLFYGFVSIGIVAGGPLGGVIAHWWGLAAPLFVYSGLCFASGALYLRYLRDPPAKEAAEGTLAHEAAAVANAGAAGSDSMWRRTARTIRELMRRRPFLLVLALNFSFFWVVAGGYDTMLPLFAGEALGMSTVAVGGVFAIAVLAEMIAVYPSGMAADRFGRKRVLFPSVLALAVVMAAVGWATTPLMLAVIAVFLGLASGSVVPLPTAMLSDVVGSGSATAVGVFRFFGDVGFVLGPIVGGVAIGALGFKWAFAIMSAPLVLVLLLAFGARETLRTPAVAAPGSVESGSYTSTP